MVRFEDWSPPLTIIPSKDQLSHESAASVKPHLLQVIEVFGFNPFVEELVTPNGEIALFIHLEAGGTLLAKKDTKWMLGNLDFISGEMRWTELPTSNSTNLSVHHIALACLWSISVQVKVIAANSYTSFGEKYNELVVDIESASIDSILKKCCEVEFLTECFQELDHVEVSTLATFASELDSFAR